MKTQPSATDFKRGGEAIAAAGRARKAAPSKSEVASLPGVTIRDHADGTWTASVNGQKAVQAAAEAFRPQMRLSTERGYEVAAQGGNEPRLKTRWRGKTSMRIDRDNRLWRREGDGWVEVT